MNQVKKPFLSFRARGVIYASLGAIALSMGGPIVRLTSGLTDPWVFLTWRSLGFAAMMFLAAMVSAGSFNGVFKNANKAGWLFVPVAIAIAGGQLTYILAMLNAPVATVAFILALSPVAAALGGFVFLKERISKLSMIPLSTALIGVSIMFATGATIGMSVGVFWAIAALVCYVGFVIILRITPSMDSFAASAMGGFIAFLVALYFADFSFAVKAEKDLYYAIISGMFQVGLGFMFVTLASRYIKAAEVTLLILIESIIGPMVVWLLVDEIPSQNTLLGGAVILVSVVFFALISLKEENET